MISKEDFPQIFQCYNCTFVTTCTDTFSNHQEACKPAVEKARIKCPHCPHITNRTSALNQHINTMHTKAIWYNCDKCSYKSTDRSCLRRHVRRVHLQKAEHQDLSCKQCDYTCPNEHNMRKHLSKHQITSLQCRFCSYATKDRSNFRKHIFIHNPRPTNCDFCDYKCGSPYQMRAHLKKVHNGVGIEDVSCRSDQPLMELVEDISEAIKEAKMLKYSEEVE